MKHKTSNSPNSNVSGATVNSASHLTGTPGSQTGQGFTGFSWIGEGGVLGVGGCGDKPVLGGVMHWL